MFVWLCLSVLWIKIVDSNGATQFSHTDSAAIKMLTVKRVGNLRKRFPMPMKSEHQKSNKQVDQVYDDVYYSGKMLVFFQQLFQLTFIYRGTHIPTNYRSIKHNPSFRSN